MSTIPYYYTLFVTPHAGWPPLSVLVYALLMAACWIYSMFRGGPPERLGTTILAIGSVLTAVAIPDDTRFRSLESGALVVDVLCLAVFVILALRADRFWPLWVAALQLLGVASHGVKFSESNLVPSTYAFMLAIWSYPMIALMVAGTWRHQGRLNRFGHDAAWSPPAHYK
jgi:hypothetical protein